MKESNCRSVVVIRNIHGSLLPYSCQATEQQVEEWADSNLVAGWAKHKEIGDKLHSCLLVTFGTREEIISYIDEYFAKDLS